MIRPGYLLFELMTYGLFFACLWHAFRQGRHRILELAFSLVYGVFLELMTLRQLNGYTYGQFLIMIGDAPLPIGMGWAAIIYSAMEFSSRLRMPEAVRPWLDGLLALNIDLAMDAVAIRLLMWTWVIPLDREWFGVPWGNFWAWFIVVSSFSGFLRLLRRWRDHPVGGWLYPALAMALSLLVLAGLDQLFASILYPNGAGFLSTCLIVGAGLAAVLAVRPRVRQAGPPDPVVIAVPLLFHLFFIGAGIYYGFYAAIPALAVISVLMLIGGVAVHLWPWWILKRKAPAD